MKKAKVYLSGRISGIDRQEYLSRFAEAEKTATMQGYRVVNPTNVWVCHYIWIYSLMEWLFGKKATYIIVLWYDLCLLRQCTHIRMVGNDWQQSRGARLERLKAREWNIKEYSV